MPLNDASSPVLLYEHTTRNEMVVAEVRLHAEATLNSLSLEMIGILAGALARWAVRDEVVALLITSAGERAFCAGGDIQALYYAMLNNHQTGETVDEYPYQFFESEYRLNYQLHTYPKPVVAIGHGIVMGGGLGIFSAAGHRIVTERSRIAMPEITIGLFPDAGASWLLRNMALPWATFLGLTGSHMNASDALLVGIGTHSVAAADREAIRDKMVSVEWRGELDHDRSALDELFENLVCIELPPAQLDVVPDTVDVAGSLVDVGGRIEALQGLSDWIDRGIAAMQRGCPTSIGIVVEQLRRTGSMSLAETFRMEMTIATHCSENADFLEGVRALIIEKDNRPHWQFDELANLPLSYVQSHFDEPWPRNPLHDLEKKR